jgi:hypothetical protein
MISNNEAEPRRGLSVKNAFAVLIILIAVILTAWTMFTVGNATQIRPSSFVALPTTPLTKTGQSVQFTSVSPVGQKGVAVGVKGFLETSSGQPIAGAKVYAHYYLQGEYRTQVATTDQNGYFEIIFPMNWTGWLTLTLTYFGDGQHQGLSVVLSLSGEGL